VDHIFHPSEKRLARIFLLPARFGRKRESKSEVLKLSQQTLADMVLRPHSRISFMNRFRQKGFTATVVWELTFHLLLGAKVNNPRCTCSAPF
jgi:hypothetical protein